MNPSFRGFRPDDLVDPRESEDNQATESNSEASDYDSTLSSRETTPTRSHTQEVSTVLRNKETSKVSVRQLVDQFSDSDTTEGSVVGRRRRKNTQEHIELPAGGEKELRRQMAAQDQANEAIKLWKALLGHLKTTLDEADQALDQGAARGLLLGHSAGIAALEVEVGKAWDKVEAFQANSAVAMDKVELLVTKNKFNTRCNKVRGHIAALTDNASGDISRIQVINPTRFGDLELPDFFGDYTEFNSFELNFKALIDNGNLDDGGKKAYLLKHIKGDAKSYIGSDGLATKTYDDVWNDLRGRYGKPWRITRAAVKKLMDIKDPSDNPKDISHYWNQISEACKIAERLKLTASSIILNMGLLKLPVDFRAKMDEKIKPLSPAYILTREIVAEPFNDVIAGELERPNNIVATLGFNTIPTSASNHQNIQGPKHNNQGHNGGKKSYFTCLLCGKKKQTHKTWQCPIYNTGLLARERMRILGRCQHCAVFNNEHGQECSHRAHCSAHPLQRHVFWLCANYINGTYRASMQQYPPQHPPQQQYPHQPQQQQQYPYQQPYLHQQGGAPNRGQPLQQQYQGNGGASK